MKRRSNEQRREQSTEAVLSASLKLFVSKGYAATSTQDIAAAAGLTKGSVYHYFKDKLALLLELLNRSERLLFEPIFLDMRTSEANAEEQLVMFFNWIASAGVKHKEQMLLPVLVSLEFFGSNNEAEKHVGRLYDHLHAELERVIRLGQRQGQIDKALQARTTAVSVVAFIDGLLLQWYRWGKQLDGAELARIARGIILNGIVEN